MSCPHPPTAQHVDRSRGTVTCTICGEVVTDQQLELDPLFSRGERPANSGGRGNLRTLGQPRPMRSGNHVTPVSQRPSVELARRQIFNIARQLEISGDLAEMATGIYKLAVTNNAIAGARVSILCACLYAVCRREGTNHTIYDFADATKESPYEILKYMRYLSEVTNTTLPPMDASVVLLRFAEHLHLDDKTQDVAIYALKLIRAMRAEWIEHGRRPLGVAAAALVAACHAFGIPRAPDDLCGMVRLTAETIHRRLDEFMATPAASILSIDDYQPSSTTLPPAFRHQPLGPARLPSLDDQLRDLASIYYELVAEAKRCAPATADRCARWRSFITQHCSLNGIPLDEDNCDLTKFSPKEQLTILGLPHAVPVDPAAATAKDEATQHEEPLTLPAICVKSESGLVDPSQEQLDIFAALVKDNADIRDLNDVDFEALGTRQEARAAAVEASQLDGTADLYLDPSWETVTMPPLAQDTDADLEEYMILDNETRVRLERIAADLYGSLWDLGRARTKDEMNNLARRRSGRKRRRDPVVEQDSIESALAKALRGKGASTVNLSQLGVLIPGLSEEVASDNASVVDDDWY